MYCIFCYRECHKSENCNKYVTVAERKNTKNGKKYCFTCRVLSAVVHLPGESCESNEECIGWYSTEHHNLFCEERIKGFKLFVPKIDQNLLSRFGDLFEVDEKYSMFLSSPEAAEYLNLPKIKVVKNLTESDNFSDTVVVIDTLSISQCGNDKVEEILDSISSNNLICVPRNTNITGCNLSPGNVLKLLSRYTKSFSFNDSTCTPNLNFTDIIKNAPNIESIRAYNWERNIQINKTWPEDLLKYKKGKNLRYLSFKFGVIEEFDYNKLREFIVKRCTDDIVIYLNYDQHLDDDDGYEKLYKIKKKLFSHMGDNGRGDSLQDDDPYIWIGFDGVDGYELISLVNCIKKRYLPLRVATKRKYV